MYGTIAGLSLTKVTRRNLDGLDDETDEEYDGWEEFLTDEAGADLSDDIYSVDIVRIERGHIRGTTRIGIYTVHGGRSPSGSALG